MNHAINHHTSTRKAFGAIRNLALRQHNDTLAIGTHKGLSDKESHPPQSRQQTAMVTACHSTLVGKVI
jgi:hypothetical protein